MPDLPTINSWGQLFLILVGIVLSIKYVYPLIRNGSGTQDDFRELRSALTLMVAQQAAMLEATKANAELLHELAQGHQDTLRLLMELERRSREQEEAIRVVLRKGGAH